jgi:uridine kinase
VKLIDADAAMAIAARSGARTIAIDGRPVSGKSTLAEPMVAELGAAAIFLDDFVRPESEWRGRVTPGFPFPYIRYGDFIAAAQAALRGEACDYPVYDWATGTTGPAARHIAAGARLVIEGVSALHPQLAPLYDLRLWIESDPATTLAASLARGVGDWAAEWRDLFLPSAEIYFETRPWERADYCVAGRGVVAD